jgi:hypothetical protein
MSIVNKRSKDLILIPILGVIGLLLSAAYILPLIYEKQFLNIRGFIGEGGGFHFADFFILPNLTDKQRPDHFWPVYYDTFVFYVFFFIILLFLFFYRSAKLRHDRTMENARIVNQFFLLIAVISIFFLFGISTFLWETIPFFKYIQFPARWLNITAFAVIFLSAVTFLPNDIIPKIKKSYSFVFVIFILILFSLCLILDYKYINYACIFDEQKLIPIKSVNLTDEHIPVWVDINRVDKNDDFREGIVIKEGIGKAEIQTWKSAERIIAVTAEKPLTMKIRTFNFPGWNAYVDGKQTNIITAEGEGAMIIGIPEGNHTLTLKFQDTPIRYYSKFISLMSFLALCLVLILGSKISKKSKVPNKSLNDTILKKHQKKD